MDSKSQPPCSDEAVQKRTGKNWSEWCKLLDAAGAKKMPHPEIAELLYQKFQCGAWWSQMVTVGYERIRGLRTTYGMSDGTFTANVNKTVPYSATKIKSCFTDEKIRSLWLKGKWEVRSSATSKAVRLADSKNTIVEIRITHLNASKCSISIQHSKLKAESDVEKQKNKWKKALEKLLVVLS